MDDKKENDKIGLSTHHDVTIHIFETESNSQIKFKKVLFERH